MLDSYNRLRERLLSSTDNLKGYLLEKGKSNEADSVERLKTKLRENRFHLMVLGQFKRGKSTFINSIIGDTLLPTSVIPLTSIVTLLKYGERESIEVIFEDGSQKTIERKDLHQYVTERGNPSNRMGLRHVEISFPSAYLRDGVSIIDTPGVGSTFENNTDMTYNYLPNTDAALFLLAVDPPISQAELGFLKDVRLYAERIFFLQNKIDYLRETEREESLAFSKEVIEKAFGADNIRIYPISARMALEAKQTRNEDLLQKSGLPVFDKALGNFLMKSKGNTILKNALNSLTRMVANLEMGLELELRAMSTPMDELEKKTRIFQEKMEAVGRDRDDMRYYFDGEINRLVDLLDRDMERMKETEIPRLSEELQRTAQANEERPMSEYIETLDSTLHSSIVKTFDQWVISEEDRLNKEYTMISRRYSERTNEIIDTIVRASAELFDIALERFDSQESLSSDSRLYYMTGDPPKFFDLEGAFDFFSKRILPRNISKRLAIKELKGKLPQKVDQNCGRVRWDFKDRIKRSFADFRWDLNLKIDATEDSIRKAIEKAMEMKKRGAEEMARTQGVLKDDLLQIAGMKEELCSIGASLEVG